MKLILNNNIIIVLLTITLFGCGEPDGSGSDTTSDAIVGTYAVTIHLVNSENCDSAGEDAVEPLKFFRFKFREMFGTSFLEYRGCESATDCGDDDKFVFGEWNFEEKKDDGSWYGEPTKYTSTSATEGNCQFGFSKNTAMLGDDDVQK